MPQFSILWNFIGAPGRLGHRGDVRALETRPLADRHLNACSNPKRHALLTRFLFGFVFGTQLVSCASQPNGGSSGTIDRMIAVMDSWEGRPAGEAVDKWGAPDSVGRDGSLEVLTWLGDNVKAEHDPVLRALLEVDPMDGSGRSRPTLCGRVFRVDAAGIIRDAQWTGISCWHYAADYAPPALIKQMSE